LGPYDFNKKEQFFEDLKETIQLIDDIYKENQNFVGFKELLDIDYQIFEYLLDNAGNDETREIVRELMMHQLYTMIRMACNFCDITLNLDFTFTDGQGRLPLDPHLAQVMQARDCTQYTKNPSQAKKISDKVDRGHALDGDEKRYLRCVLQGDLEDTYFDPTLRDRYVMWLMYKVETGISDEEKEYMKKFFIKNKELSETYRSMTLQKYYKGKGIAPETRYDQLSDRDFREYYARYIQGVFINDDGEMFRHLNKINKAAAPQVTSKRSAQTTQLPVKRPVFRGGGGISNLHELFYKSAKTIYLLLRLNELIK
jgi:hypothetical protein